MPRLNKLLTGHDITDEVINRTSSTSLKLDHDTMLASSVVVRTAAGGGGTLLTLTTDYTLGNEDTDLSTEVGGGAHVYTTLAVVNGAYHSTDLYVTYKTVGDYASVESVQEINGVNSVLSKTVTTADVTLTEAECLACGTLVLSGALTGARSVILPAGIEKSLNIIMKCTGNYALTIKTPTGDTAVCHGLISTDETAIQASYSFIIASDGTNVYASSWSVKGSNANGKYIKHSNRKLETYGTVTKNNGTTSLQAFSHPHAFVAVESGNLIQNDGSYGSMAHFGAATTTTQYSVILTSTADGTAVNSSRPLYFRFEGTW